MSEEHANALAELASDRETPELASMKEIKKLGKKTLFIPGCSNRMNYFILTRIMPRKIAAYIANRTMGNMYVDKKNTNSVK